MPAPREGNTPGGEGNMPAPSSPSFPVYSPSSDSSSDQLALVAAPLPPAEIVTAPPPPGVVLGSDRDVWFAEFWDSYPRRAGKGAARQAWAKARRRGVPPERLVAAARAYAADPNRQDQFTAHPATWLNQERWDDGPLPARGPTSAAGKTVGALAAAAAMLTAPTPTAIGPAPLEALPWAPR